MSNFIKRKLQHTPIRVRLTLWYLLLAGLAVLLSGAYQYIQLQRSLFASVDTSLEISVSQALSNVDSENGRPAFQNTENQTVASRILLQSDFAIRLLTPDGIIVDGLGDSSTIITVETLAPGYQTIGEKDHWRVYSQPIQAADGQLAGWLQAIQSLEVVEETLENMRTQLLIILPMLLLLTGMGGVFLANRALRPIDQITRTAKEIGAGDLSHRIAYQGPQDEVGRLAQTFDNMLGRLQAAFEQERRFSGDAAHELRTPLTALKGQIEVALGRPREQAEYENTLRGLVSQVDRLIRLSNALLFLSRSDQKRLSWEPAPVNLAELLDIIIEQILPLADEHKLSFLSRIPIALP
ncbi:MAG: HAMP domain-containing protein, partial [Chloroflexota bacterium]